MMNFIEIFEQWIKDGNKDIYMLPTIIAIFFEIMGTQSAIDFFFVQTQFKRISEL